MRTRIVYRHPRDKGRQIDVFRLRCLGYMPKEIADVLGISVKTAEWHWRNAVSQLDSWGVRRELERAIHWAITFKLIQPRTEYL